MSGPALRRMSRAMERPGMYAAAAALVTLCAFPLAWMLSTALKPPPDVLAWPPTLLPPNPTAGNFARLFSQTNFLVYFRNSMICAWAATTLSVALGAVGAYSLTRFRYPGRETVAFTMLFTYLFPPIVLIVPFYILFRQLGLANSYAGLILAYTAFALPFSTWMLWAFFQSIPLELEEAALVDGAGRPRAVLHVVLPLALPGVIAVSIFTFIVAWNDYLFARVLMTSEDLKTLPVGVQDFFSMAVIEWGTIMAAGVMITIPALVFFVAVQRYLIRGWGTGGVKG